jgi:hypothetical protein
MVIERALLDAAQIERRVRPEHVEIDRRLKNWGRWCRSRPHYAHVFSIEGRYRAPRGAELEWETATPPPSPLGRPDDPDGLALELVIRLMPRKHRMALKFLYVFEAKVDWCRRRLGLSNPKWERHIDRSRQMVINLLLTPQAERRDNTTQIRDFRVHRETED